MTRRRGGGDGAGSDEPGTAALLRADPALVEVVAQLLWAAAPQAQLLHDDPDDDGLIPLYLRTPLPEAQAAAFERGLDALLNEASERRRGTYLREVRDLRGRRRELARPVAPGAWREAAGLVGPFEHEAAAARWVAEALPAGWFGDPHHHGGAWYADVFRSDGDELRSLAPR